MTRAGLVAVICGLALTGCATPTPPAAPTAAATAAAPAAAPAAVPAAVQAAVQIALPDTITIPALHVDAPIVAEGLDPHGAMAIPPVTETGWWNLGPRPGSPGAAVVVGHVNWDGTPGAFAHLAQLKPGDQVTVTDHTATRHVFTVYAVTEIPKVDYTARTVPLVFGPRPGAELVLVTCGGRVVDRNYLDNIVVSARLT